MMTNCTVDPGVKAEKFGAVRRHLPDVVVAELGVLRPVEQHRPGRRVYGLGLGSGAGHLVICLAVAGGRSRRS